MQKQIEDIGISSVFEIEYYNCFTPKNSVEYINYKNEKKPQLLLVVGAFFSGYTGSGGQRNHVIFKVVKILNINFFTRVSFYEVSPPRSPLRLLLLSDTWYTGGQRNHVM